MTLSIKPPFRLTLLVSALAASFTLTAQAQKVPDDGLQVVEVTAQKRKEKLQDVPIAATAISARDMEMRGVNNLLDLAAIAPNLSISKTPGDSTASQISIRGSVTNNPGLYWEPTVGMYVDGVYSGKSQGSVMELLDLERIEVLRGPQGTLYGRNTLAGAVNFITRKPSGELGGSILLDVGNYNARVGKVSLDLPQVGIFKASVGLRSEKREGWIKTKVGSSVAELNNRNGQSSRIALDADVSKELQLTYRYDSTSVNQNGSFSQVVQSDLGIPTIVVNKDRQTTASVDGPSFERMDVKGQALGAEWKLDPNNTVKYTLAQRKLNWDDALDLDGSPVALAHTQRYSVYTQTSNELQLVGSQGSWNYVLGAYGFTDEGNTKNPQTFFFGSAQYDSRYGFSTSSKSLYGNIEYQLNSQLKLTGGLRNTKEEKTVNRYLAAGTYVVIPATTKGTASFSANTPLLIASYKLSDQVSLYAKYTEGFKSGGFNGEANDVAETLTPFRPELTKSYEGGLKSTLDGGKATINVAIFQNQISDLQESIFTAKGAAASNIRNAGKAATSGIEVEFAYRPTSDLRLQANYGYLNAKYDEFIDGGVNVANNRAMPHAPKNSLNLMVDATLNRSSFGVLRAVADYTYLSSQYMYAYQLTKTDPTVAVASNSMVEAAGYLNLRLLLSNMTIGQQRLEAALWVRNAMDNKKVANYIDFGPGFGNLRQAYYADPRTFGVSLKTSF